MVENLCFRLRGILIVMGLWLGTCGATRSSSPGYSSYQWKVACFQPSMHLVGLLVGMLKSYYLKTYIRKLLCEVRKNGYQRLSFFRTSWTTACRSLHSSSKGELWRKTYCLHRADHVTLPLYFLLAAAPGFETRNTYMLVIMVFA